mmetsp:Transcript_766/g.2323  ORF Transcript_766/g.2323 Transcript_766/m.2323 type:complete len:601 (+) Transcript_766:87-1889(+)|eukprot:CAMPEP_0117670796 /NCGR_PEP_ID=MMETSP0804-20121206/12969_1 /TAXON_ID=1074897 /ORGANISM="Tetraselmis astigmatica, Strain CCMP880" /LENGTH=600 /DNA_ID=CAMNT_0005479169 /DNA_START=20 /DNA_END=1822 /DNA_ORIENTATION=+
MASGSRQVNTDGPLAQPEVRGRPLRALGFLVLGLLAAAGLCISMQMAAVLAVSSATNDPTTPIKVSSSSALKWETKLAVAAMATQTTTTSVPIGRSTEEEDQSEEGDSLAELRDGVSAETDDGGAPDAVARDYETSGNATGKVSKIEDGHRQSVPPHADARLAQATKLLPSGATWCGTSKLSQPRSFLAGVTVNGYLAMFAGGVGKGEAVTNRVDIYNARSRKWSTAALSMARSGPAAAAVGNLAFFAGGMGRKTELDTVDIFDSAKNLWLSAKLSTARKFVAGCAADTGKRKVVVFAGGTERTKTGVNMKSARVDIYDVGSRKWSKGQLSEGRTKLTCTSVGSKVIIAGGYSARGYSRRVDVLDVDSMRWKKGHLRTSRQWVAAASAAPLAFFGGGQWCNIGSCRGGWIREDAMDVYNHNTGGWAAGKSLMEARSNAAGASTPGGEWVAIAGGNSNVNPSQYFTDPSCRCNCQPSAKFFPAAQKDVPGREHMIKYPKIAARDCKRKRSSTPVFTKSSALDLYNAHSQKWTQARLPIARALNAAAGVAGKQGLQFLFAGGEIRTVHMVPTNAGGRDYYTDRVDFLCLSGAPSGAKSELNR